MPTSVRLDPETESLLKQLARRSGQSKSAVLREAVHRMAAAANEAAANDSLFTKIADLAGVADGGPATLARDHKKAYRDALVHKHGK
jgi:predicted transcriptional regulator